MYHSIHRKQHDSTFTINIMFTDLHLEASISFQNLSKDLATLGNELVTQGSKLSCILGSESGQQCVDDLCRVLPVVQASLTRRQKQLVSLQQDTAEKQRHLKELHSDFTINKLTIHRLTEDIKEPLGLNERLQ
ncbi:hypothetical protein ATANTOWER_025492, partial [Ataeniobius toweri]|nr:hypothetical protein [Ataeniobius toweri]